MEHRKTIGIGRREIIAAKDRPLNESAVIVALIGPERKLVAHGFGIDDEKLAGKPGIRARTPRRGFRRNTAAVRELRLGIGPNKDFRAYR